MTTGKRRTLSARVVPLLMAASFGLLAVFCAQWATSQYGREKARLHEDIAQVFAQAERETMDSLLLQNLVQPLLKRSTIRRWWLIKPGA